MKNLENKTIQINIIIAIIIFAIAFWLRYPRHIAPFWTDEYSSASQALLYLKHGLNVFFQSQNYIEYHNILPHSLIASSFLILGKSVLSAKIPFIVMGSILPVVVFFVSRKMFDTVTSFSTTLFTLFSYWFITWSQQARGYPLQQVLFLLFLYLVWESINKKNKSLIIYASLVGVAGVLTHLTFVIPIISTCLFLIVFFRKTAVNFLNKNWIWISACLFIFLSIFFVTSSFTNILNFFQIFFSNGFVNNVWYYHAFLWREYGIITLMSLMGWIFLLRKNYMLAVYLFHLIACYLFFYFFIFPPYVSRYLLVIFPLFFLLASYAIKQISHQISKQWGSLIAIMLSLFIIINGNIFSIFPKLFYSVNHTMREIALIDYDKVYDEIQSQVEDAPEQVAVIDTWPDRRDWYLSDYDIGTYTFRWENEGLMKQTPFTLNAMGEKEMTLRPHEKLISTKDDLIGIIQSYPKGFLWIDDSTLPRDVIDYAEQNLDVVMTDDHYKFDDNPYSLWPATLYSWGVSK